MRLRILASVLVRALPVVGPFLRRLDRMEVLALLAIAVAVTLSRGCSGVGKPTPPADPRHIVPVDLSQA